MNQRILLVELNSVLVRDKWSICHKVMEYNVNKQNQKISTRHQNIVVRKNKFISESNTLKIRETIFVGPSIR